MGREAEHQKALMEWIRYHMGQHPELKLLYHIPNGGQRPVAVAAELKRQGVKAGVPDLCLPVARRGYHGLYIELKADGGKASKAQKEWLEALCAQGYLALCVTGWTAAAELLTDYLDE